MKRLPVYKNTVCLNFVGDVMLGEVFENFKRGVKQKIIEEKINPFEYCNDNFKKSDINIANLECVISNQSNREKPFSELMRVPNNFVSILKDNHIHLVNLANNHTLDHGELAFNDMVLNLNNAGIKSFGYGIDSLFQTEPLAVTVRGITIGFLGYNLANLNVSKLKVNALAISNVIKKTRNIVDILVLSLHWGYEYVQFPAPRFIRMGKKFLECGSDILYGHHSHYLQGVVKYKNRVFAPESRQFRF